jgi:glycosylphosphatidylinositol transamidase (GPIT) subunit GPI8
MTDRMTYFLLQFMEHRKGSGTLQELFGVFSYQNLHSHAHWSSSLNRPLNQVALTEFFSALLDVKEIKTKAVRAKIVLNERAQAPVVVSTLDKFWNEDSWGVPGPLFV